MKNIGQHLIADLYEIDPEVLKSEKDLMNVFKTALDKSSFNVIKNCSHKFPGDNSGVTGIFLLSESHASFHSYPENSFLAIDIFSCSNTNPEDVLDIICEALKPKNVKKNN